VVLFLAVLTAGAGVGDMAVKPLSASSRGLRLQNPWEGDFVQQKQHEQGAADGVWTRGWARRNSWKSRQKTGQYSMLAVLLRTPAVTDADFGGANSSRGRSSSWGQGW